jgi:hypothetical protein
VGSALVGAAAGDGLLECGPALAGADGVAAGDRVGLGTGLRGGWLLGDGLWVDRPVECGCAGGGFAMDAGTGLTSRYVTSVTRKTSAISAVETRIRTTGRYLVISSPR